MLQLSLMIAFNRNQFTVISANADSSTAKMNNAHAKMRKITEKNPRTHQLINSFCKKSSFWLLLLLPYCSFVFLFLHSLRIPWLARFSICVLINILVYHTYSYPICKRSWARLMGSLRSTRSNCKILCVLVFLILQVYFFCNIGIPID